MNYSPKTPEISLWTTWPTLRIVSLIVLLMLGDLVLQSIFYAMIGGLFIPVLLGTIGGVFVPLVLLTRATGLPARIDFSLHWPPPIILGASGLMAIASLAPTSLMAQLSLHLRPPTPEWTAFMAENMPEGTTAIILSFLTVVIVAPLAEELIFRGLLYRLSARQWGIWPAMLVSSLIFGLIHGEPWYLFGLVGVGIVLAVVYQATGSVIACWVTHMVHNGIAMAMMVWVDEPIADPVPVTPNDLIIAGFSLLVLILLGRFLFRSRRPQQTGGNLDQN